MQLFVSIIIVTIINISTIMKIIIIINIIYRRIELYLLHKKS